MNINLKKLAVVISTNVVVVLLGIIGGYLIKCALL